MMENKDYMVVITACPDNETAKVIARTLVEKRLAACAQMFPVESVYTWQGEVCGDNEVIILIKSKKMLFDKIMVAIKTLHPYEVPEIIQVPITDGFWEYLKWIDDSTEAGAKPL